MNAQYFDSVTVSFNSPSSTSCMTATEVIGLLIEAMRKMVPSVVGVLFSVLKPGGGDADDLARRATPEAAA